MKEDNESVVLLLIYIAISVLFLKAKYALKLKRKCLQTQGGYMLSKISLAEVTQSRSNIKNSKNPAFTANMGVSVKYIGQAAQDVFEPTMIKAAQDVLADFKPRAGVKGQFLDWVMLPKKQLERGLDRIYDSVDVLNKNGNKQLTVLGIGGSKHTIEAVLNLSNLPGKRNVHFYSDIDNASFKQYMGEIGGDITKTNFLVVSKSGTTFEAEDPYLKVEKALVKKYKEMGYSQKEAQMATNAHFTVVTDANESSSKLRRIANEKGYASKLYVHDDVGGRFSALDDHGLFALAYAGLPKDKMVKMLKSADKMTQNALNPNIEKNMAMQKGIFYAQSVKKGSGDFLQQLFGRYFEGGSENWLRQMHFESLKDSRLSVGKAPDSMHYAAEAHFDPRNQYNSTLTMFNAEGKRGFTNYNTYTKSITNDYSKCSPTSVEKLDINSTGVTPEAIGAYAQLKHFETIFKGMLRRAIKGEPQPKVLDEVLQPSVETYKIAFKPNKDTGKSILTPGSNK